MSTGSYIHQAKAKRYSHYADSLLGKGVIV